MRSGVTILLEWVFNLDDFNKIFLQVALAISVTVINKLMADWFGWKIVRETEISNMF